MCVVSMPNYEWKSSAFNTQAEPTSVAIKSLSPIIKLTISIALWLIKFTKEEVVLVTFMFKDFRN
jgi:hypothetical protein